MATTDRRRRRWRRISWAFVLALTAGLCGQGVSGAREDAQMPDLVSRPVYDLQIERPDEPSEGEWAIRFATSIMNLGPVPLDVMASSVEDERTMTAAQCVRWESRVCFERRDVGSMRFESHASHLHWHFIDIASYELRSLVDGDVDLSDEGLIVAGRKQGFCLMDSESAEEGALVPVEHPPFYVTCTGLSQGISPYWQDTYGRLVAGQQIVIDGVPDGAYALVARIDPDGLLYEMSKENNVSVRIFELAGGGTEIHERSS